MMDAKLLLKTLRDEWSLHLQHVRLLQAQQAALLSCDRDEFCRLHAQHEVLLTRIAGHKATREEALHDENGATVPVSVALETVGGRARRSLESVRDGLRRTLEMAQELTQRNARLIENDLTFFAHMMDLYVDAARQPADTYTTTAPAAKLSAAGRLGLDRRA